MSSMSPREWNMMCCVYSKQLYLCLSARHIQLYQTSTVLHLLPGTTSVSQLSSLFLTLQIEPRTLVVHCLQQTMLFFILTTVAHFTLDDIKTVLLGSKNTAPDPDDFQYAVIGRWRSPTTAWLIMTDACFSVAFAKTMLRCHKSKQLLHHHIGKYFWQTDTREIVDGKLVAELELSHPTILFQWL